MRQMLDVGTYLYSIANCDSKNIWMASVSIENIRGKKEVEYG